VSPTYEYKVAEFIDSSLPGPLTALAREGWRVVLAFPKDRPAWTKFLLERAPAPVAVAPRPVQPRPTPPQPFVGSDPLLPRPPAPVFVPGKPLKNLPPDITCGG
jgi:hypothetical protein